MSDIPGEESPTTNKPKPPKPKPGEISAARVKDCKDKTGINPLSAENIVKLPIKPFNPGNKITPALEDEIISRLLSGETMASIVRLDHMPAYVSIWEKAKKDEDFAKRWQDAKRDGAHYIADDCLRIADDPTIDPMHKRIMVDTRIRLIKSWHRKAYGDNVQLSGDENGSPVRFFIDGLSDKPRREEVINPPLDKPKE